VAQLDHPDVQAIPPTHGSVGRYLVDTVASAQALFWVSTLILWYPWSINEALGITLLLTLVPALWAFAIAALLLRWPGARPWAGAACTAAVMLAVSAATAWVFFGVVRDAGRELLQPAAYAGCAWVAVLPFLVVGFGRRWIERRRTPVTTGDIVTAFSVALGALAVIAVIVVFER
jgi:hypothetical protein